MFTKKAWLMAIAMGLFPVVCFAQADVVEAQETPWQEVGLMGGLFYSENGHANLTGTYMIGAFEHLGFEFDGTHSFLSDGGVTTLSANLTVPFMNKSQSFLGYAVGGAGISRSSVPYDETIGELENEGVVFDRVAWDFTLNLGFGFQIRMTEGLWWRMDYRAFLLTLDDGDDTDHYHRVVMGLSSRF